MKKILLLLIALGFILPVYAMERIIYKYGIIVDENIKYKKDIGYLKVIDVAIDSPGHEAGITKNDKIIQINNRKVESYDAFKDEISRNKVNKLTIERGYWTIPVNHPEIDPKEIIIEGVPFLEGNTRPLWEEFCPYAYVFAKAENKNEASKYREAANYWLERKEAYNKEISTCDSEKTNRASCYLMIRQIENQKNAQLRNEAMNARSELYNTVNNVMMQNQLNTINSRLQYK